MSPRPTPARRPLAGTHDPADPVWTALAPASAVVGWLLVGLVVAILLAGGPHWVVPVFVGLGAAELALLAGITYRVRALRPCGPEPGPPPRT